MPPVKGKKKREPVLRCYNCDSRKVHAERGSNTRVIHGKKRTVANVVCDHCGNEWWSYHSAAIKAMRQADADAASKVHIDADVVQPTRQADRNRDVDSTDR